MQYEELQLDRVSARDEIFAILKEANFGSYVQQLGFAARNVQDLTGRGRELHAFLDEAYKRLEKTGKIKKTIHQVMDSEWQRTGNIYFKLYVQGVIFEEVMALVREGIVMLARIHPDQMSWTGTFVFDPNHLLVTEYGTKVLADHQTTPYFSDEYIRLLSQTAEPDDELKGYLSEGLACLHNSLPRAAILLLRLPCEHILQKMIDAVDVKMPDETQKNSFKGKIRKASINLEQRASVVFDQLIQDPMLLSSAAHLRDRLNNELKPTFHNIREFAGNAAHRNVPIDREQVRYFYGAFASAVYPIAMKIVQHLHSS